MEWTDELRVDNEGLTTRICKLVAFVQQNNGGRGVGAMLAIPRRRAERGEGGRVIRRPEFLFIYAIP